MADFVLADPPVSLEERYGSLAGAANTMPALGLLFIAAHLRKNGFTTAIIDSSPWTGSFEDTIKEIVSHNPRFLGLTATTLSVGSASRVAEAIKIINDNIIVFIGGPHVTAIPEETLRTFQGFDGGVVGEGELTMLELAQAIMEGRSFNDIPGLVLRNGSDIYTTSPRPLMEDLDILSFPAFDLLENFPRAYHPPAVRVKHLPAASFVSSRGCPNQCIFCDRAVFGRKYRFHSAEYILDLVEMLRKDFGVRELLFEDDTLVLNKKRLVDICEGFLKRNLRFSWSCLGRTEVLTPELFRLMKRAGCWQISFGIESGDQHILDVAKKNVRLEKLESVIRQAHDSGLRTKGFFILGFPEETLESLQKTHDCALRCPLDDITINFMTPFPGSEIYDIAPRYGTFDRRWELMNMLNPVFVPKDITREDMKTASNRMYRDFYLRPRIIFSYISRIIRTPRAFKTIFSGFLAFIKLVFSRKGTQNK